ncbi:MAG: NAD(P)-binding protein [Hyphomicrobiaceae bacterium]
MPNYDYLILGCGVAGLCAAQMLRKQGSRSILIIDQYSAPGGNQMSHDINGYTFDIGAFYYWPSMPLFQMFPAMAAPCPRVDISIERISPLGAVHSYPFSVGPEFIARGPWYWLKAISSLGRARLNKRSFATAEDYAVYWMGRCLYADLGMADYITRFFDLPADQIEAQFAIARMQPVSRIGKISYWVDKAMRSIKHAVRPSPSEHLLVRPERGMAHMYGKAVTSLRHQDIDIALGNRS